MLFFSVCLVIFLVFSYICYSLSEYNFILPPLVDTPPISCLSWLNKIFYLFSCALVIFFFQFVYYYACLNVIGGFTFHIRSHLALVCCLCAILTYVRLIKFIYIPLSQKLDLLFPVIAMLLFFQILSYSLQKLFFIEDFCFHIYLLFLSESNNKPLVLAPKIITQLLKLTFLLASDKFGDNLGSNSSFIIMLSTVYKRDGYMS